MDFNQLVHKIDQCGGSIHIRNEESLYQSLVQYRIGDMHAPKIEETEALGLMVAEFLKSIRDKREPLTGAKFGIEVMRVLEAADTSLKSGGAKVYLEN